MRRKSVSESPRASESPDDGWVKVNSRRGSQSSQDGAGSRPESPSQSHSLDLIEKLKKDESETASPSLPVLQLPMFNAQRVEKPSSVASLKYESSTTDSILTGTRPKLSPILSGIPAFSKEDDCIYESDEDIPFEEAEKLVGLSPIGTPNWSGKYHLICWQVVY